MKTGIITNDGKNGDKIFKIIRKQTSGAEAERLTTNHFIPSSTPLLLQQPVSLPHNSLDTLLGRANLRLKGLMILYLRLGGSL